jgi:hypothetical protein
MLNALFHIHFRRNGSCQLSFRVDGRMASNLFSSSRNSRTCKICHSYRAVKPQNAEFCCTSQSSLAFAASQGVNCSLRYPACLTANGQKWVLGDVQCFERGRSANGPIPSITRHMRTSFSTSKKGRRLLSRSIVNDSDNSFVAHRMLRGESGELGAQGFPRLHSHPEKRLFTTAGA